jgi:hypothetical protein
VDRVRYQFPVSDVIAAQLVSHDLSGFTGVTLNQAPEKPFCRHSISLRLEIHINNLAILVDGSSEIIARVSALNRAFILPILPTTRIVSLSELATKLGK